MDLVNANQRCIKKNREIVQRIRVMRTEIDNYRAKYLAAKTAGAALGIAGGVGLMLAPFTFGTSLLVSAGVGVAGAISGAAVNITTDIIDRNETKDFVQQMERLINSRKNEVANCAKIMDKISEQVASSIKNGESENIAFSKVFCKLAGIPSEQSHKINDSNIKFQSAVQAVKAQVVYLTVTENLVQYTGMKALTMAIK